MTCRTIAFVDRHFAGRISPRAERTLREHLPSCLECHAHYERLLVLGELDPRAATAEERLARGLGLAHRRQPWGVWAGGGLVLAAAVVCLLVVPRTGGTEFTARGGAVASATRLTAYRLAGGAAPAPVDGAIGAADELAFAYENGAGKERLAVFGVDEHRHVFWFHPAWQDAAGNPAVVAIAAGAGVRELPEAVSHALDGRQLVIYGVFTDTALSVRELEDMVASGQVDDIPDAIVETIALEVHYGSGGDVPVPPPRAQRSEPPPTARSSRSWDYVGEQPPPRTVTEVHP